MAKARLHENALRGAAIAILGVTVIYALAVRPALSAWAGADGNAKAERMADPSMLKGLGFEPVSSTPEEFSSFIAKDVARNAALLGTINFQPQ